MTWTYEHPEAGYMAEISVYASRLRQRITALDDLDTTLASAQETVNAAAFGGAAGDAWRDSIRPIRTDIATMRRAFVTLERASYTYKSGVDDIAVNAASVRHRMEDDRSTRAVLATHAYDAPGVPERIAALDDSIDRLERTLHGYAETRTMLDNAYCAALESTATINSSRFQALLARYGPEAFTGDMSAFFALRDTTVDEFAELAERIAAGEGSDEDYERLEAFLRETADDPALASAFWLRLGGEKAYDVLYKAELRTDAFSEDDLAAFESFASAFRQSLSAGSAEWTDAEASAFADGLFTNTGPMSGLEVISYLFDDPDGAPMGPALTVATATIFDEWERNPERIGQMTPVLVEVPATRPLGQLMFEENSDMGLWDTAGNDPMSRVLETLGGYPEESLDWLTDGSPDPYWDSRSGGEAPSTGEGRIDYWFGERTWNSDGFTGAGTLFDGALSADDGIRDPSAAYDSPTIKAQMDASSHVLDALGGAANTTFTPETLAPDAQNEFGKSLATLLPRLAESPITQTPGQLGSPRDGGDYVKVDFLEPPEQYLLESDTSVQYLLAPNSPFENVARVWGAVGATPGGLAHLDAAVNLYTTQLELAALSGADGAPGLVQAFDRIAEIEGFHTGSMGGAVALEGMRHDKQFQEMMDNVDFVVGLVPIPSFGDIPVVSQVVTEAGVKALFDAGEGMVEDAANDAFNDALRGHWGAEYTAALDAAAVSDLAGRDALAKAIEDNPSLMAQIRAGSEGSTSNDGSPVDPQDAIDSFVSSRCARYRDKHLAALEVNNQDVYDSYKKAEEAEANQKADA